MTKNFIAPQKPKAQALVEFALILTLLLTLLYGILEAGRLMFIYASTVTAARQATRYGSATGNSPTTGGPYYKDCTGIRAAAQKIGFLAPFASNNIFITYDTGPDTTNLDWTCGTTGFSGTDQGGTAATGNRIKVCVSTQWSPIVGALVPLRWSGTQNCSGTAMDNAITKQSERTILSSVSIGVTAAPGTWTGTGGISLTVLASPTTYSRVGDVIRFAYTMRNSGSEDLEGSFSVASNNVFVTCGAGYVIYPGKTLTCYGNYTVTQTDLDAGSVVNTATASTSGASSNIYTITVNSTQSPKLTLAISASSPVAKLNDVIVYTYTLTNTGNITLSSPSYAVTDNKLGVVTCPSPATLAPGGVITCTDKTHTIDATDVNAKVFINTATLTYAQMSPTTQTATAIVDTAPLVLTITATPSTVDKALQVIAYKYIVRNNHTAIISNPVIAASNTRFNAACPSPIPVGGFVECIVNYAVTQPDMDAGNAALVNTATASGNSGGLTSRSVDGNVPVIQSPALTLAITSATPTLAADGITTASINFTYLVTNSGNISLTPVVTSTVRSGALTIPVTCPAGAIPPAAAITCTGTMNAVDPAVDVNYVINKAVATAGTALPVEQTVTVPVYNGVRLALGVTASKVGTQLKYVYALINTGNAPITLPSPYEITYTIVNTIDLGTALPPSPAIINCAPATSTIAINSSVTCTTGSSFTTTLATGILRNTATALAPPFTDSTTIMGYVDYDVNLYCKITHSGPIPNNTSGLTSTWRIYNKTASPLHITSITVEWHNDGKTLKHITLGGTDIWDGTTLQSGITIDKDTGNTITNPDWADGLDLEASPQRTDMTLRFSAVTDSIRVVLAFSEEACSAGLDSGYDAQREMCTLPTTPSGTPSAVMAADNRSVNVTWATVTGATSYNVYVSQDGGASYTWLTSAAGNSYTHDIQSVASGTTLSYKISAEDDCGEGSQSTASNTVTKPACALAAPSGTPSAVVAADFNSVAVSWAAVTGASSYNIYVSQNGASYTWLASPAGISYTHDVSTTSGGTTLSYKISAVGTTCEGPQSTASNTVTITRTLDKIVSGTITETVGNRTASDVTITGLSGGSCSKPTASTFTCTMAGGTGSLRVGNYSESWNNNNQKTSRDNMVCLSNPVTTYGTPWGTTGGTTGATDTTTFTFSALTGNVPFNILISNQAAGTPSGYTCYPGTIP